jgi:hypothetical protein
METLIRRILAEEAPSRPLAVVASEVSGDVRYQLAQLSTQMGAVMRDLEAVKMGLHSVELNVAELKATARDSESKVNDTRWLVGLFVSLVMAAIALAAVILKR